MGDLRIAGTALRLKASHNDSAVQGCSRIEGRYIPIRCGKASVIQGT